MIKRFNWQFWQYLLPQHLMSRLVGILAGSEIRWLKNFLIRIFIRFFKVDLSEANIGQIDEYKSFNHFFVRSLKPEARQLPTEEDVIVSPVDGVISHYGVLQKDRILQVKEQFYSLYALLADDAWSQVFINGAFMTFYLAPNQYHRVHAPFQGILKQTIYVPGRLFSVNQASSSKIPQLYTRNERVILLFDIPGGQMAVILVGAMLVGHIETVLDGQIVPMVSRQVHQWTYPKEPAFVQGAEVGRFLMGSSVIILFNKDSVQWLKGLKVSQSVHLYQSLGYFTPSCVPANRF